MLCLIDLLQLELLNFQIPEMGEFRVTVVPNLTLQELVRLKNHLFPVQVSAEVPEAVYGMTLTLVEINDSLASLSSAGGFQKSLKAFCDQHNIGGWIRQSSRINGEVHIEGTTNQLTQFMRHLNELRSQGMIATYVWNGQMEPVVFENLPPFLILPNSAHDILHGDSAHDILYGDISGNEFDSASQSSADQEPYFGAPSSHSSDR